MGVFKDIKTGERYRRLTIIEELESSHYPSGAIKRQFLCKCDCGKEVVRALQGLRAGTTISCGCHVSEMRISQHKKDNPRLYSIWCSMKGRCYGINNTNYHNYGGRGIKICNEWVNDFESFCKWALSNGYSDDLSIDRIDVNGDYCPENCRWTTMKVQHNNRRDTRFITYKGVTKSIMQWSEETGFSPAGIWRRLKKDGVTDDLFSFTDWHRHKTENFKDEIISLYMQGVNRTEISRRLGFGWEKITNALKRWSVINN